MVDRPVAEWNDDDFEFQTFRFVYGHDAYGILFLRRGERAGTPFVAPPGKERIEVGRPFVGILQYEVEKGLYENIFVSVGIDRKEIDYFFAYFI